MNNSAVCSAAQSFGVSIVTSETGIEFARDRSCSTIFVVNDFENDVYDTLYKSKHPILGPPAIQQLAIKNDKLPNNIRPLYTTAMVGAVVCFTGFRNKEDLVSSTPIRIIFIYTFIYFFSGKVDSISSSHGWFNTKRHDC